MAHDSELVIIHTIDAPREQVFKAWTEAEALTHWWGPAGFTVHVATLDLRPGGMFHYRMDTPDGNHMWGKFVYGEIVAPEKLEYVNSFSDEAGNIIAHPLSATWPLELHNTMTLTEEAGKTTLTLRAIPINATDEMHNTFKSAHEMMHQGFAGTINQLAEYLRS